MTHRDIRWLFVALAIWAAGWVTIVVLNEPLKVMVP